MTTPRRSGRETPVRSPQAFGRAVRSARQHEGLSQLELAQRATVTRQAIVALEGGHETRAVRVMFDSLAALGLELCVRPRGA